MIDRVNRVVLLLLGLALCAAGAVAITGRQRALRLSQPAAVYHNLESSVAARPSLWLAVVIVVAALLGLLGLVYALRQIPTGRTHVGTILLRRHDRGTTRLESSAVSKVAAADFGRIEDVTTSRVQMRSFRPQPSFAVRLDVGQRVDVDHVRSRADEALRRLRHTLGVEGLDVDLRLRLRPEHAPPVSRSRVE